MYFIGDSGLWSVVGLCCSLIALGKSSGGRLVAVGDFAEICHWKFRKRAASIKFTSDAAAICEEIQ